MTRRMLSRRRLAGSGFLLAFAGLLALAVLSMTVGKFDAGLADLLAQISAMLGGAPADETVTTVFWNIRLPRVVAGLAVGAALAAAGATYQGLFRNPLVSPDILGVSAGASFGAVIGIFLSLPVGIIQLMSFAGGLIAVFSVYAVAAAIRNRDPVLVLVLAGIAVGALVGAGISLIKILADPYDQLPAITCWLLGSLASVTSGDVVSILPALVVGIVTLFLLRWRMNVMTLGEEEAKALGIDTGRLRVVLVLAATLITAAAVSITGIIGWIGLVIPHVARLIVGPDFVRLLPVSMALGAAYLLVADILARSIALIEVPLGILTATVGAPFFLWLLASGRKGWQ
ncbi:iron complex transport system permease protein [Ensifer adhaerens]|uniref:Iron complex transport system permease protein n=1 Tax=Ensifer adhaerens TaxID=106592 RepID=A0ACC5T5U2_ENSAD|nr:iron ABC transporter permease [Ensifer adhaerens]MBP1876486.1 iron complex transport system permease protein [Ensifer adhaerens]